jgi:hypothetical protein
MTHTKTRSPNGAQLRTAACATALLLALCSSQAGGVEPLALERETPDIDAGVLALDYAWDDGLGLLAERFELAEELPAELSTVVDRLIVRDFPTAPGQRGDVVFERVELYAPTARIIAVDDAGERELPRSPRVHLLGFEEADPSVRVALSVDPDGGRISGVVSTPSGAFEIREFPGRYSIRHFEVGVAVDERLGIETRAICDTPDSPQAIDLGARLQVPRASLTASGHTHEAVVAFDTDGEFLADYGNDVSAANSAIGDLLTALNVIYERDLGLRLLQGETVLRTNSESDPYASSATRNQLDEVGYWWEVNKSGVERVWVALLSGKGFSNGYSCSAAGIAWVDQYCDEVVSGGPYDGGSYSATQVLRCVPLGGSSNTNLIGHEIGHNAGSGHTHCYAPEVDQCYNAQNGCYSGVPSCPDFSGIIPGIPAGKGTVMSYCNFGQPSGAGCGSTQPFFHPTVSARIQQSIEVNTPGCVQLPNSTCQVSDYDLAAANNADSGPFITEGSITAGSGYAVETGETIVFRAALWIKLEDGFSVRGTFTATIDPLIDCP